MSIHIAASHSRSPIVPGALPSTEEQKPTAVKQKIDSTAKQKIDSPVKQKVESPVEQKAESSVRPKLGPQAAQDSSSSSSSSGSSSSSDSSDSDADDGKPPMDYEGMLKEEVTNEPDAIPPTKRARYEESDDDDFVDVPGLSLSASYFVLQPPHRQSWRSRSQNASARRRNRRCGAQ